MTCALEVTYAYDVRRSRVSSLLRTLYVFLRSRRLIVYVVRLLRSGRLILQVLTVRSYNDLDCANRAVTELLWVRPIVR